MTDTVFSPFTVTLTVLEQRAPTNWSFGCPGAELIIGATAEPILRAAALDYGFWINPPQFLIIRNPNTPDCCPPPVIVLSGSNSQGNHRSSAVPGR